MEGERCERKRNGQKNDQLLITLARPVPRSLKLNVKLLSIDVSHLMCISPCTDAVIMFSCAKLKKMKLCFLLSEILVIKFVLHTWRFSSKLRLPCKCRAQGLGFNPRYILQNSEFDQNNRPGQHMIIK